MGEATPAAGERDGPGQLSPSSSALAVTPLTRTITSFNSASVRRSAVIVFAIAGALLLSLWLFEVARHFSFLVVLAWLFAIALEPGFRELVAHGRSRGIATTIMGGRCDPYDPSAGGSLRATVLQPDHGVRHDGPDAGHPCHRAGQRPVRHHARHHDHHVVAEPHSVAGPGFFATIAGWMPPHAQRVFLTVSEITIAKTGGNVISKIVLAALSAGFHAVSSVAIGVPCRLPFALFVGSTAQFVPIVGTYLGIILPVLATVFISPWKAIAIVAFAAVYQQTRDLLRHASGLEEDAGCQPGHRVGGGPRRRCDLGPVGCPHRHPARRCRSGHSRHVLQELRARARDCAGQR